MGACGACAPGRAASTSPVAAVRKARRFKPDGSTVFMAANLQYAGPMKHLILAACCFTATSTMAQPYSATREGEAIRLADARAQTEVWILPSVGNIAYRMTVKGHDILRWPHASLDAFKASPNATGIPFMGPWINRLDEQAFYANGKRYAFDMSLGNIRGAIPIHGFITTTDRWQLASTGADRDSAWATSRLEFHRQEAWMKQWPFAHTIEM